MALPRRHYSTMGLDNKPSNRPQKAPVTPSMSNICEFFPTRLPDVKRRSYGSL
jgi:hypothetical protein